MTSGFEGAWNSALPNFQSIRTSLDISNGAFGQRITRVSQLDAELLDQELAQLLQEPIGKALALVNVCSLYDQPSKGDSFRTV